MKTIPACLRSILLPVLLLLVNGSAYASHIVGVDLFYTWISGSTYQITLIAYGDCGPASSASFATLPYAVPQICIFDGNSYITSVDLAIQAPDDGVEITPVCARDLDSTQCTNESYATPGIKKFVYTGTYTVPYTSATWRFLYLGYMGTAAGAGRAAALTNISSGTVIQVVDTLNNTLYNSSSPVLTVVPTPFFCLNNNDNYNPGATYAAGDSVSFFLVSGMNAGSAASSSCTPGGAVTYIAGTSATDPLQATTFSFNKATGQISFYPNVLQRSLVVYNIEEYDAGSFVGSMQREMSFLVLTCTNTAVSGGITGASGGIIADSTGFQACTNAGTISFTVNPTEAGGINDITVTDAGLPAGATFTITGNGTPTPHCTFSWVTTGVAPGTYTFYATYTDNNCPLAGVETFAYTITILAAPTISYSLISAATCAKKAAISIIPGGGGSSWTIDVSNALADTIQSWVYHGVPFTDSLSPGSYTLTIYMNPSHECEAYTTVTIIDPVITIPTATFTNPTYCGADNGTITLYHLPAGTTDTVKFSYNGVVQTARVFAVPTDSEVVMTGLAAGVYSDITVTYGLCVSSPIGPVVLTNPPFTMRAYTSVNPTWCGLCNGSITLYGLHPGQTDTINYDYGGGAATPIIQLIGADSTVTLTGLCTGFYVNLIANTAGTCISNTLGPVDLVTPPFTMRAITYTNPLWCGLCDGTVTLYGLHPSETDTITYTYNGVAQTPVVVAIPADSMVTLTGLCAGVYANFVATTGIGGECVTNTLGPVTLSTPPFTMRTFTSTNPSWCGICNGTITLYGLYPGETDTITYNYEGAAQPPVIATIPADSMVTMTGLCAGTYTDILAKTGGTCLSNLLGPVALVVPPFTMRAITYTNPSWCGICDGTVTLYGLHPGEIDTINYTYNGIAQPPVVATIPADSIVTLTGLCAGVYANFIATTGGVCVSNTLGPVTLTVPPFTMRALSFTNPDYCGICNGTVTLYGLHPGEIDTITYTDGGVAQAPFVATISADSTVVITGLCAGLYADFVAKTGGDCISNTLGPADLTVPPFTMRALGFTNPVWCGICNGTITLYGLHPGETDTINYTYNGVAQTPVIETIPADSTVELTGLCFGVYANFIANTGGVCVSNTLGPADLTVPPFVIRADTYTNPTECGFCDGTITLYGLYPGQTDTVTYTFNGVAATAGAFLIGSDSTVEITGLCEGIYSDIVARTAGVCVSNALGPDTLVAPPIIDSFTYIVHLGCNGDTLVCMNYSWPAPDLTYIWDFGDGSTSTATNPTHIYYTPGTFTVTLYITNTKCYDSSKQNVTLTNLIVAGFTAVPDSFLCQGAPVTFTNTSLGTLLNYTWDFGDGNTATTTNPVHIYTNSGTYDVVLVVTNYVPCQETASMTLQVDSMSAISIQATDSVLCGGHEVTFTGTYVTMGNTGITWTFGDGGVVQNVNPVTHSFASTGVFTVSIEAFYRACPDTGASRQIVVFGNPAIDLGPDTTICAGSSAISLADNINAGNPDAKWLWNNGETTPAISVSQPGTYYSTVSIAGCSATDSVTVQNGCYLDIPNAFTPNGDGINDYFFPRTLLSQGLATFQMSIYNRWGQLLFETSNTEGRGWDGRFNGVMQPEGVYVYVMDATFIDGEKEHHQGNVTLL